MAESKVSLRGLKCPLPALKTRKLLARLAVGDVLEIECTDPLTTIDIPNLLRETGDQLEDSARKGKIYRFRIRKS
jgi:tRNA 2-thiouridine synthesizing protein A